MKYALISLTTANLFVLGISALLLPSQVAMQFGLDGSPSRWGYRSEYLTIMGMVIMGMTVVWIPKGKNPEKDRFNMKVCIGLLLLFFGLQTLGLAAQYQNPVHLSIPILFVGLGLFLAYLVYLVFQAFSNGVFWD